MKDTLKFFLRVFALAFGGMMLLGLTTFGCVTVTTLCDHIRPEWLGTALGVAGVMGILSAVAAAFITALDRWPY